MERGAVSPMLLSIVIPVLNEARTVPWMLDRLRDALGESESEVLFIDNGSADAKPKVLQLAALTDARVKLIRFSRNLGRQTAVPAGLDFANGFTGMILLALGAIGDYVARNYEEAKGRPLYVVTEAHNLSLAPLGHARAVILSNPAAPSMPLPIDGADGSVAAAQSEAAYQPLTGVRA